MSKAKSNPLNGVHTSGIYSDLSIDGPEIGTVVLVVDRAKNLPNRKTIGKQDPYCAARLGKEAKKTATDIRGGQTPRWDQELRFVVHDSPDYYQLKVSTFSDDKKTELIGETWVDLRDIIVSGGGQSDQWHTLNCRGKYAGEIRIEITYYDSRPKMEKKLSPVPLSAAPSAPSVSGSVAASNASNASGSTTGPPAGSVGGPRVRPEPTGSPAGPLARVPKRRPLPSDPITGQAPAQPPVSMPPTAPAVPAPQPLQPQQPQQPQQPSQPLQPPVQQMQPIIQSQPQPAMAQLTDVAQLPMPQMPLMSLPQTPPRQPIASVSAPYTPTSQQSPLPLVQYSTPPQQMYQQQQVYDTRFDSSAPPPPMSMPMQMVIAAPPSSMAAFDDPSGPSPVQDRPPPPPMHRSRNNSTGYNSTALVKGTPPQTIRHDVLRSEAHRHSMSSAYPGRPTYRPLDGASPSHSPAAAVPSPPRHWTFDSNGTGHDGQPQQVYEEPASMVNNAGALVRMQPQQALQYQPSYEYGTEQDYGQVPSPAPLNYSSHSGQPSHRAGASMGSNDHRRTDSSGYGVYDAPSPSHQQQQQQQQQPQDIRRPSYSGDMNGQGSYDSSSDPFVVPVVPSSLVPGVDPGLALELRSRIQQDDLPYQQHSNQLVSRRGPQMIEGQPGSYGADGSSVYASSQYQQQPPPPPPPQQQQQQQQQPQAYASQAYNTPPQPLRQRYDHSPGMYSPGASAGPVSPSRPSGPPSGASPAPRHTIRRKSVSPAPARRPSVGDEGGVLQDGSGRRLSGIPFGPDSYDALNPAVATANDVEMRPDYNEVTGKIIAHDGREIDPSDHLPVESWAPEPEPKQPKPPGTTPTSEASTGRRQLRIAGRPQSSMGSTGVTFSSGNGALVTPTTTRNRLQKKAAHRQSTPAGGGLVSMSSDTSPLAPLSHPRQQDNYNSLPRMGQSRSNTFDMASSENSMPLTLYGGSPGGSRGGFGIGPGGIPAVPAKVPIGSGGGMGGRREDRAGSFGGYEYGSSAGREAGWNPVMSGAMPAPVVESRALTWEPQYGSGNASGYGGNTGESALVEEMSRIDLGSGRARRHQGRY